MLRNGYLISGSNELVGRGALMTIHPFAEAEVMRFLTS